MPLLSRRRRGPGRLDTPAGRKLVLHVGCGKLEESGLHERYRGVEWHEVRLDVDPGVKPDVVASITDMSPVPDASVDAVYSHHNIEHVYGHEVSDVLKEFLRVLKPGGEALIATPDLQGVARAVAAGRLEEPLYRSRVGSISALDVVYGFGADIATGREYMAHRTGYTLRTLRRRLAQAGFVNVDVVCVGYALWASARKPSERRLNTDVLSSRA